MKLLLIRHAEAHLIGEAGATTEFDRALTELGHRQAEALARVLAERDVLPDLILTSPYRRAMQTAQPIAARLTPNKPPVIHELLQLEELRAKKLASSLPGTGLVVLIGHQPDLCQFAGWLLGIGGEAIAFEKAGAALFACGSSVRKGQAELQWLVSPEWFLPKPMTS
jgi:phosphohistidine phosphatase